MSQIFDYLGKLPLQVAVQSVAEWVNNVHEV